MFLFAWLVSSCNEDELVKYPSTSPDSIKFIASFEGNESRTYIEKGRLLRWTAGDQISMFVANTLNQQYQFEGKTGANSGYFNEVIHRFGAGNDLDCHYAVYPYDSTIEITDDTDEPIQITATLPAEQKYAENSFGLGANTMVAVTEDTNDRYLKFKNVGGYLKLQLYGDDVTIKSIALKGNCNEKLAGKATIVPVYSGEPTIEMSAEATEMITLNCGEGVKIGATAETATAFWMVVPPTIFEGGLTITITDMEGNEYTKSTSNKVLIERNVINPMSAFEVKNQNTDIPYVTFTAEENQTLTMSKAVVTLEYSLDGKTWNELSTNTVEFGGSKGVLLLRGMNAKGTATYIYNDYANIGFGNNVKVACKGDIRTLIDYENYETVDTKNARFSYLFANCTCLISAPSLPMKTLAYDCYQNMFAGCTSLKTAPELPATSLDLSCYRNMFLGCTSLTDAPELPATTLANHCYNSMFYGCTSLTKAPKLPAMVMTSNCYDSMFYNCTSLTEAPALPSTTLEMYCYRGMFAGCTNLTSAPQLPAQTLAMACYESMFEGCTKLAKTPQLPAETATQNCYAYMFAGCTSLTTTPDLPATVLTKGCYEGMFEGCTSLTTAPSTLPAMNLDESCYENMFKGCTSLTKSPELPATTMIRNCYRAMFEGCTSLTTAPMLPATTLMDYCYCSMFSGCSKLNSITMLATTEDLFSLKDWVKGVAATGTFIKAKDMNSLSKGDSGIPEGWTVVNYGESNNSLTVTLTEAGTLGEYLTDANRNIVEELKIIGDINGTDIQLIREITKVSLTTGAPTEDTGALIKLDLSEANIVAGGNPYKAIRPDEEISTQNNVVTPGMFGYTNLKTIVLPDNIKEIGESAFEALLNMETFTIPTSVTKIADKAFNTCQNLSSVSISTNVTEIGSHAFYDCKSLTEVTIPGNVSTIGSYAFGHCVSLLKVYCESLVPPALTANSFQLCNALQAIYVPSSAIDKYKENAVWKQYNIIAE